MSAPMETQNVPFSEEGENFWEKGAFRTELTDRKWLPRSNGYVELSKEHELRAGGGNVPTRSAMIGL